MGKIHDALEKSGKTRDLSVISSSKVIRSKTTVPDPGGKPPEAAPMVESHKNRAETVITGASLSVPTGSLDPNLIAYHDPNSVEAEIFKILRTNLLFPKSGESPRSIMVTSAIPGDGKSFVASNLAISIAQGIEEHVLLMDCDMRRSSIHKRFGLGTEVPGLSDYLSGRKKLESLLRKTVVDKLTILPGGPIPKNPAELLSSQTMKNLLQETKNRYKDRYVVVDSPPPQLTAETTALANYIEGIIIVVKYGSTPKELVVELVEKLGREKILGVVMNGYRVPVTDRYGYGRYQKGK